ncbi:hypothetical protein F4780DRAFT_202633 [Xylariomycetidae sp. FL0641]|nr:hypothetical protein F4780DRAFT_202633 [Xylariomycetidae sp. FL0641]
MEASCGESNGLRKRHAGESRWTAFRGNIASSAHRHPHQSKTVSFLTNTTTSCEILIRIVEGGILTILRDSSVSGETAISNASWSPRVEDPIGNYLRMDCSRSGPPFPPHSAGAPMQGCSFDQEILDRRRWPCLLVSSHSICLAARSCSGLLSLSLFWTIRMASTRCHLALEWDKVSHSSFRDELRLAIMSYQTAPFPESWYQ